MKEIINKNDLLVALNDIAENIAAIYRSYILQKDKVATGKLYRSTLEGKSFYFTELNDVFQLEINLPDEAEFIEYGRKPGSFPPVNAIKQWVRIKRLVPKMRKKIPEITLDQAAFLVGRSIKRDGIKPIPLIDMSLSRAEGDGLYAQIDDKIELYYDSLIDAVVEKVFND